ncbi:hypothetical protein FKP32DRAFT_1687412 [Trametes sanguinea]|nr:hypothetical protein FKP32DRAFT_1687412 [Trametes sanguinea]
MGPAPHAAAGPYVAQGPANRPNPEPVPGVYEVLVTVLCTETVKRDFTIRTDCTWEWLCTSVKQRLDEEDGGSDEAPKFGYKISTADTRRAPYTALSSAADWKTAMSRVSGIAAKARTRTVGIEIVDLVRQEKQAAKKSKAKKKSPKKRKRTDADSTDDEDENIPENATQAFRELKEHLFCQLHAQHCYVSAAALSGGHAYVSNKNLMLWAKAMSRGEADKHNPPHYLEFERVPKTPRGQQGPYRHLPEIHVHIRQPKPRSTQRRSSAELTKPSRCSNTSGSPGTPSQASPAPSLGESPKPASSSTPSVLSTEASSCQVYPWIDYPDLEQLLSALDAQDPTSGFLHLRDQLTRAAFTNVEDITCISPAMLYLLVRPRIPPSQILALYSQAEVMIAETHQQRADEISQWEQLGLTNTTSKTVNNEYDAEVAEGLETEEESTVTDDYTTTTNGGSE